MMAKALLSRHESVDAVSMAEACALLSLSRLACFAAGCLLCCWLLAFLLAAFIFGFSSLLLLWPCRLLRCLLAWILFCRLLISALKAGRCSPRSVSEILDRIRAPIKHM